jgi:hypothetical protein
MSYQLGPADPEERSELYADPREEDEERPRSRVLAIAVALGVMALFAGGLWFAYTQGMRNAGGSAATGEAPLIKADTRPTKVKPEQPGGMQIPDRDKLIYSQTRSGPARPMVEHLLPPAEKPLPRPTAPPPPAAVATAAVPPPASVAEKPAAAPAPASAAAKPEPQGGASSTRAPAAAPKPPSPRVTPVSTGGGARIQLGSVRSEELARREWERIKRKNPDLLGGLSAVPVRADLGDRGVYYRIQTGPVGDPAKAERICAELKQRDLGCIIAR